MAKKQPTSRGGKDGDRASPEMPQTDDVTSGRSPDGRFASPHSGNPNGRPRKPKMSARADLTAILDGDENPVNQPIFAGLNLRQSLMKSACLHGLKNWRAALAILALEGFPDLDEGATDEASNSEPDALELYFERQLRRRRLQEGEPPDTHEDPS